MTENDMLMKQAESHSALRRLFLAIQAVAYIGWIGSRALAFTGTNLVDPATLTLVQTVCWPVWLVGLLATFWLMRKTARNRQLAALVDDERTVRLAGTVFQVAFWVLLVAVALVYAATYVTTVDARAVMPILLSLGVAVPSLAYAALYRS